MQPKASCTDILHQDKHLQRKESFAITDRTPFSFNHDTVHTLVFTTPSEGSGDRLAACTLLRNCDILGIIEPFKCRKLRLERCFPSALRGVSTNIIKNPSVLRLQIALVLLFLQQVQQISLFQDSLPQCFSDQRRTFHIVNDLEVTLQFFRQGGNDFCPWAASCNEDAIKIFQ